MYSLLFVLAIFGREFGAYQFELPMRHPQFNELDRLREEYERRERTRLPVPIGLVYEQNPPSPRKIPTSSLPPSQVDFYSHEYMALNIQAQSWSFHSLYQALNSILRNPFFEPERDEGTLIERSFHLCNTFEVKISYLLDGISDPLGHESQVELTSYLEEFNLLFKAHGKESDFWVSFWIFYSSNRPLTDLHLYKILSGGDNKDSECCEIFKTLGIESHISKFMSQLTTTSSEGRLAYENLKGLLERFQKYGRSKSDTINDLNKVLL